MLEKTSLSHLCWCHCHTNAVQQILFHKIYFTTRKYKKNPTKKLICNLNSASLSQKKEQSNFIKNSRKSYSLFIK